MKSLETWAEVRRMKPYYHIPTVWMNDLLIEKEKNEIATILQTFGSFSKWLNSFGKNRFHKSNLRNLDNLTLLEIHTLFKAKLPLPYRIQRELRFFSYLPPCKSLDYVKEIPEAGEIIAGAYTLVEDEELPLYVTEPLEFLKQMVNTFEKNERWTDTELRVTTNTIIRLIDARQSIAGFFLKALHSGGVTDPSIANPAPHRADEVRIYLERVPMFGFSIKELDSFLGIPDKPGLASLYKRQTIEAIEDGVVKPPPKKVIVSEDVDVEEFFPYINTIQMTKDGLEQLEKELRNLNKKRKETVQRLKEAKELGDISENSEYDDAREQLGFIDGKIAEVRDMISRAEIVESGSVKGVIAIGSEVVVRDIEKRKSYTFKIVGETEGNILENKISTSSPLGKTILGKKEGKLVVVRSQTGEPPIIYKIVSVK